MKKKFLAWLMTLAMMVNMVAPYAAYADELPVGDDTYVSAGGTDFNNNDATDVEGEPTAGEPSADGEQPATGEPAGEPVAAPADGNTDKAESDGKEVGQPVVEPAAVPNVSPLNANEGIMPMADDPVTSGDCSATDADKVTWKYDAATTTLTISGTGAIKGYFGAGLYPWSSYKNSITKVVMENGVTGFGVNASEAFEGYTALTEISLADTVTDIGQYTFKGCTALTTVTLPDKIKTLAGVFQKCTKLASVKLPANLEKLDNYAFNRCTALTGITLPESLTEIGNYVFQRSGLTSVTIPGKVTKIGDYAFTSTKLASVKLPDSVTSLGKNAFLYSEKLTDVTLSANLTEIPQSAFKGCSALKNITIPDKVTKIGNGAFGDCTALESVSIPDGVTIIDEGAFSGCAALKSVTFPAKLTTLGESAFEGCTSLAGALTIPQTVTKLDDTVFKGCTGITEVTVPTSVNEWGRWGEGAIFQNCTGITKATVGAIAQKDMFKGCTALKEVKILDGVKSFGTTTFSGCTALTTIDVPASLTDWGSGAFAGVDTSKITFTGAGKDNFNWEGDLLYNKDKTALLAVKNITGEFTVPDNVTTIGPNCFSGCAGLTAIKFGENSKLASIGDSAFDGCTGLTAFNFPKGDLTLGAFVFQNTGIVDLVIPANVKEFGEMGTLPSLKTVKIYAPITALPTRAFAASNKLESIYIPASVQMKSTGVLPLTNKNMKYIYYGGSREAFEGGYFWKSDGSKVKSNNITVLCDYVEPTTEVGKLEVVAQPADIACDNVAAQATDITMQLKYPDGTTPAAGDKIWVNWYYTTQATPNGLAAVLPVAANSQNWDADTLTASTLLNEQAGKGQDNTWHYILVAYKTDAAGNTTMMVSNPVKVALTNKQVDLVGTGKADDPYVVSTADQMLVVAGKVNSNANNGNIKLAADITLPKGWAQLGSGAAYSGTFDGDGHTITFANGAKGLVKNMGGGALIKNLNIKGEYITGSGFADYSVGGKIDNCKLLSGTCTLNSGFVGEAAATGLPIINCEVQDNVKIGWNAAKNVPSTAKGIGSFAGWGSFNIVSCKSAADVYGTSNVGGIAGFKGYSMRVAIIKNCTFTGSVTASGEFAGGIMARGYDADSAPNTPAAQIDNCCVIANISGVQGVGGIYGGEAGLDQCWDNGIGTLRNCVFYGSVKTVDGTFPAHSGSDGYTASSPANNVGGSKGGIVGFMRSLNRNNIIENNYYYITDGNDVAAIGAVEHIDTTAVAASPIETNFTGVGSDTPQEYYKNYMDVFYYSTANAKSEADIAYLKWFVDREDYGTANWTEYMSVIKPQLNRTDDPLGKDKEKLGKAVTATEMTDADNVLKALNTNASSMGNWELTDGAVCPTISDKAVAYQLEIGGTYKTEYYIGDELDMTGATFTATWSDGTTTSPALADISFSGFDSTKRNAAVIVTAKYGAASTTFTVKVLLKDTGNSGGTTPTTLKVKFTLLGDKAHDEYGKDNPTVHALSKGNLETWIKQEEYTIGLNDTVWDLLQKVEAKHSNVKFSNPAGNYVNKITFNNLTMEEKDNTANSGWMYTLNGHHPQVAVNEQFLENGDKIVFHWTDDYTIEEGSEEFDNSANKLGGGGTTETKYTASEVIDLIDAIGTVTKDSKSAIAKARAAYDSLTEAQQKKVTNYDKLTAAEAKYTELTGEKIEVNTGDLPFTDVRSGAWYYDAIKKMYDKGLMNGESEKQFMPNSKLSRAMLVTILYRLAEEPTVTADANFTDVAADQWYTKAVAWASSNNIVGGVGDGKFAPNDNITRQELAAMLYRYAKAAGLNTTATADLSKFSDGEQVADWAVDAMKWAVGAGLIKGDENGALSSTGTATRAEVVTVIVRLIEM